MRKAIAARAVVFLGGGRITDALCAGLRMAAYEEPIVVHDRNSEKLRALRRESRIEVARDLKSAIERADMLIIAVRPASVADLLDDVAGCGATLPKVCVSLAAGVPLQKLRTKLGSPVTWVRAMPSPVSRIGRGLTGISFYPNVSKNDRARVRQFFGRVGPVIELPERQMDAFTAVYSSSHGYHALAALANAAHNLGLDRKSALTAAAHALADGIVYRRISGQSLDALLHEAATPGGIAAASMAAANKAGYERAVARGLQAGIQQARKNAKG